MFGFLKERINAGAAEFAKFRDREAAEAVVAIMTGTSYADGEFEAAEKAKFVKALSINPVLKQFDTGVLLAKHRELAEQYEFDTGIGEAAALKELRDLAEQGAPEDKRLAVLRMGMAAAMADGELEEAEAAFLRKAAKALGLDASQVGL